MGKGVKFAVLYTFGNIVALAGTFFVCGPQTQIRKMSKKGRAVASAVFLTSMILTLVVAFSPAFKLKALVVLLLVLIQWCAMVWYVLSYIPFARQAAKGCFGRCFRGEQPLMDA